MECKLINFFYRNSSLSRNKPSWRRHTLFLLNIITFTLFFPVSIRVGFNFLSVRIVKFLVIGPARRSLISTRHFLAIGDLVFMNRRRLNTFFSCYFLRIILLRWCSYQGIGDWLKCSCIVHIHIIITAGLSFVNILFYLGLGFC